MSGKSDDGGMLTPRYNRSHVALSTFDMGLSACLWRRLRYDFGGNPKATQDA